MLCAALVAAAGVLSPLASRALTEDEDPHARLAATLKMADDAAEAAGKVRAEIRNNYERTFAEALAAVKATPVSKSARASKALNLLSTDSPAAADVPWNQRQLRSGTSATNQNAEKEPQPAKPPAAKMAAKMDAVKLVQKDSDWAKAHPKKAAQAKKAAEAKNTADHPMQKGTWEWKHRNDPTNTKVAKADMPSTKQEPNQASADWAKAHPKKAKEDWAKAHPKKAAEASANEPASSPKEIAMAKLKNKGAALVAPRTTKVQNSVKSDATRPPQQPTAMDQPSYQAPMEKVAKMAMAAVAMEAELRKKAEIEAVRAQKAAEATARKAEVVVAKVEAAREARAQAQVKSDKAKEAQENLKHKKEIKKLKNEMKAQEEKMKAEEEERAELLRKRVRKEAKAEAAAEAEAREMAQSALKAAKEERQMNLKAAKEERQMKAHIREEKKEEHIQRVMKAIQRSERKERLQTSLEKEAEAKARAKAKKHQARHKVKVAEDIKKQVDEAILKEAQEMDKKVAEAAAAEAAEQEADTEKEGDNKKEGVKLDATGKPKLDTATKLEIEVQAEKQAKDLATATTQLREETTAVAAAYPGSVGSYGAHTSASPQAGGKTAGACRSLTRTADLDSWCDNNCRVGFCPLDTCSCATPIPSAHAYSTMKDAKAAKAKAAKAKAAKASKRR